MAPTISDYHPGSPLCGSGLFRALAALYPFRSRCRFPGVPGSRAAPAAGGGSWLIPSGWLPCVAACASGGLWRPLWRVLGLARVNIPIKHKTPCRASERFTEAWRKNNRPVMGRFCFPGVAGGPLWPFPPWPYINSCRGSWQRVRAAMGVKITRGSCPRVLVYFDIFNSSARIASGNNRIQIKIMFSPLYK